MAAEHLIITGYKSGNSQYASYDPTDILTSGLSSDGYVTINNFSSDAVYIWLFDSKRSDPDRKVLADYGFQVGVKTKLSDAFPGISLPGTYLWSSSFSRDDGIPIVEPYSSAGPPSSPKVTSTLSRTSVDLSWEAGGDGTNNSVTGYDVQYRESSDGSSWGSWITASGSPTTNTKLSVSPPSTVGNYYQFRVRTRGSAGESYYSEWVTSTNTLRRKWNEFGEYTDAMLTAKTYKIRAVYLTELHTRVNAIRTFYGVEAYNFTAVTAGVTKISKWATLIQEIRTAIDEIKSDHEAWNTLEVGKPRIANITQLRNIINNM